MSRGMSVLVSLMIVVLAIPVVAVAYTSGAYYQAESRADINYTNSPYARIAPDLNRYEASQEWFQTHLTSDGSLIRPTEITLTDLDALDILLGTNDMNGIWHQITLYGPIKDFLTLSKIKVVSMSSTKADPQPSWCISEGEAVTISFFFNLLPGTYDGSWAYSDD